MYAPSRGINNYDKAEYFILRNAGHLTPHERIRTVHCIKKYSWKYQVDPLLIAKQQWVESRFKYWIENEQGACGGAQIKPWNWKHKLYEIDDGKLGIYLRKRRKQGKPIYHKRYFQRIGYGVECQCNIMAELIDLYGEDLAIIAYGHKWKTAKFYFKWRGLVKYNKYLRDIKDAK